MLRHAAYSTRSSVTRLYHSTLVSSKSAKILPSLRQRRPIVNGEAVAFHVNDLASSYSYNNHNTSETSTKSSNTRRNYESDLVVVLDMDECLIHSQFLSSQARSYAWQMHNKQQQQWNKGNKNTPVEPVNSFRFTLPEGDLVHVNVRPGLEDFLEFCTSRFETHIFTAAMSVYADVILDKLDPQNTRFAGRWYREHCHYDGKQNAYVKKLDLLPPLQSSLDRVVLVDNNPLSFLCNPNNGILVSSFFNDPHDSTLPAVQQLLIELDGHKGDVKPILRERFGLEQALQKIEDQFEQSTVV